MADYYPLIARAVSGLGARSTPDERLQLYERASKALIEQLLSLDPPLPQDDIEREKRALGAAIARVEDEASLQDADPALFPDPPGFVAARPGEAVAAPPAARELTPDQPEPPASRHPRAPRPEVADRRWARGAVVLGGIAFVVAITGYAAWRLRDKASDFQRPAAEQSKTDQKFADRIGEAGAPPQSPQAPARPPAPAPTTQAPVAPAAPPSAGTEAPMAPAPQQVTVLQRAVLLEEPAEQGQPPRATPGTVLWRLDTVPGGDGGVVDNAVHATLDLSNNGIMGELILRKNRDPALPASHTIEARFETNEKSVNGKIRDMGLPEMRIEEGQRGVPLAGLPVPVMENLVLIGLSNLPADVERNLDLLKTRNWFAVLVRFTNSKRALILFEKGPPGESVMQDAMKAWAQ